MPSRRTPVDRRTGGGTPSYPGYTPGTATDRTVPVGTNPGPDPAKFNLELENRLYQQNPSTYQLPAGARIKDGKVVDETHLVRDLLSQGALAGAGAAGIYGLGGLAAGGGGTAAAAATAGTTGVKSGMGILDILKLIVPSATSLIGGALAGDSGTPRTSFKGTAVDPTKLLTEYMKQLDGMGGVLTKKLNNPQNLTKGSVAQSQDGFAIDPAATDPSILNGKGLDIPEGLFGMLPKGLAESVGPRQPDEGATRRRQLTDLDTSAASPDVSAPSAATTGDNTGEQMQQLIDFMTKNRRQGREAV